MACRGIAFAASGLGAVDRPYHRLMDEPSDRGRTIDRRRFLAAALAIPLLTACSRTEEDDAAPAPQDETPLAPTPECADADDVSPSQTEGPFFTPDSPERTSLIEAGVEGTALTVTGRVLSTACRPVGGALLDFWQADDAGEYDNDGYRLRGHQFADDEGRWRLETIVPGLYTGRTRHIHVKVQAADRPVLTTQLYFPGEPANATDGIFDPALVLNVSEDPARAGFTFVLDLES